MSADKYRTDHLFFAQRFEKIVDDMTQIVFVLLQIHIEFPADFFRFFQRDAAEILAGLLIDRIGHVDSLERSLQGYRMVSRLDLCRTQHFERYVFKEVFIQFHHAFQIGIGNIGFDGREFRIVLQVHAFVSKQSADLVDTFHASDDQSLQIKLCCDTQIEILVQSIVVGYKRSGTGAAQDRI